MSFGISYIINDQLRTVNIGKKSLAKRRSGALKGQSTEMVLDTTKPFILDFIEFATDSPSCQLDIVYKGQGTEPERTIGLVRVDGLGFEGLRPSSVTANGSGPFEIVEHNVTTNRYKYKLDRPLEFPEGCFIRIQNWLTTDQNVAVRLYGREF